MNKVDTTVTNGPVRSDGIRLFRIQVTLLIFFYTLAVYLGIYLVARSLLIDNVMTECSSYAALVLDMRAWNAVHGGVWLNKDADTDVNPYLAELGVTAEIKTETGQPLVLRNPAAMTQEVGELTYLRDGVRFHLTSEEYLNPDNRPDPWEAMALRETEDGRSTFFGPDIIDGVRYYRYMRPLTVDETCVGCHGSQGYRIGDVRGGISISVPMQETTSGLRRLGAVLGGLTVLTLTASIGAIQALTSRMHQRVREANAKLREMAITDGLTGVANRSAVISRLEQEFERAKRQAEDLSVIMLDLDRFKRINDTFGHGVGDCALRGFAERVTASIRVYDVLGRVGGEEFVVVVVGGDRGTALHLAERILGNLRSAPISCKPALTLTASAGVASVTPSDVSIDSVLARADEALYRAKDLGRDRVEIEIVPEAPA